MSFKSDYFDHDIENHLMYVISDNDVYRHLRFRRPGSMSMHFDLLTWPGYLCYTGDMGTYVFRRLHDMFQFFRRGESIGERCIDIRYWAEKLEAIDRVDGVREWTPEKFREEVRDFCAQHVDDEWPTERKAELWKAIDEQVCSAASLGEHHAWVALCAFDHDGFQFQDWESDCKAWTHRFLWCCHALEWAIATYDRAKQPTQEAAA